MGKHRDRGRENAERGLLKVTPVVADKQVSAICQDAILLSV